MSNMSPRTAMRMAVTLIAYRYLGSAAYFLDDDDARSALIGILPAVSLAECIEQTILISVCDSRIRRIGMPRPGGNRSSRCQNSKTQHGATLEKPVALHSRKQFTALPVPTTRSDFANGIYLTRAPSSINSLYYTACACNLGRAGLPKLNRYRRLLR